jgi:hypothetical protein
MTHRSNCPIDIENNRHYNYPSFQQAPLAQVVEQLTLNQWALGSNP